MTVTTKIKSKRNGTDNLYTHNSSNSHVVNFKVSNKTHQNAGNTLSNASAIDNHAQDTLRFFTQVLYQVPQQTASKANIGVLKVLVIFREALCRLLDVIGFIGSTCTQIFRGWPSTCATFGNSLSCLAFELIVASARLDHSSIGNCKQVKSLP